MLICKLYHALRHGEAAEAAASLTEERGYVRAVRGATRDDKMHLIEHGVASSALGQKKHFHLTNA